MNCQITFQKPCDVLVCGSSLYAIDTAIAAAAAGHQTVLAMERTNPFIECICSLRSRVPSAVDRSLSPTLGMVLSNPQQTRQANDRLYFNPHQVALQIEDRLIESGVTFYYNAAPVAALMHNGEARGAVFGGKPGLFAIEAGVVVDCSLNSVIARTAGVPQVECPGPGYAGYTMELVGEHEPQQLALKVGGISGSINVHRFFADFELRIDDPAVGPFGCTQDFVRIYDAATAALNENGLQRFRGADVYFHSGQSLVETCHGRAIGIDNLFVFGPMSIAGNDRGQLAMLNPLALHECFAMPGPAFAPGLSEPVAARPTYRIVGGPRGEETMCAEHSSMTDTGFDEPGAGKADVVLADGIATIETDVLIAGCGTSGVGAAYRAGKLGLSPLCVDGALEIGGTNTVGGVTNLWFGNNTRAFEEFFRDCGAANDGLNASPFFTALRSAGATILPGTVVCGTGYSGRALDCVYAVSPEGLVRIKAGHFVDSTGDGSLAAWSGCDYTFGSERDGISSWGSFGNFQHDKPEAARQFLSMVDERSPGDVTRFIIAMRRSHKDRLEKEDYVHPAFYVAPRTTRHIKGRTTVTYLDMLAGRRFKDGVLRAKSNIDTKGTETSNAYKAGFYPYERLAEFEVTVPYSSLVPLGVDNLIVVGKAYSITNDALTMARMQRDLFVLGMVAAEAVEISKGSKGTLGDVPVKALQDRLIDLGALQPDDVADDDFGFGDSAEDIANRVLACEDCKRSLADSARLLLLGRDTVMPLIERIAKSMTPALARLLCFWKIREGIDAIRSDVERQLSGDQLPLDIHAANFRAHMLPDHGFSPMPVLQLNNLALAGDHGVTAMIEELAEKFEQAAQSHATLWGYAFGAAYVAERMADPAMIDPLKKILAHPAFSQPMISSNDDLRDCTDIDRERRTYLRLCLTRALARCGSKDGTAVLLKFLDEARASFAVNARNELIAVTGKDFGYNRARWEAWLHDAPDGLPPVPVTEDYQ